MSSIMHESDLFISRKSCPCCENSDSNLLFSAKFNEKIFENYFQKRKKGEFYGGGWIDYDTIKNGNYILVECSKCKLVYQKSIPGNFLMSCIYEKWVNQEINHKYNLKHHGIGQATKNFKEIFTLVKYFKKPPNQLDFLDFGLGWGIWAKMAQSFAINISGVELSKSKLENAQKHNIRIVDFQTLPTMKFDYINTEQVFEHIEDPYQTLMILKMALKPGGIIKLSVPHGQELKKKLNQMKVSGRFDMENIREVAPFQHINCFNHDSLLYLAKRAGLKQKILGSVDVSYVKPKDVKFPNKLFWTQTKRIIKQGLEGVRILGGHDPYKKLKGGCYLFFTKQ